MQTKQCVKCREYLPATTEFFHRDKCRHDDLFPYCKRCRVKDRQRYDERQQYKNLPYKRCSDCDEWKHHDEFYSNSHTKDGLHAQCKECAKSRARQWVIKYPDKYREKMLNRYWSDPEGCKARFRAYYQDNRKALIAKSIERSKSPKGKAARKRYQQTDGYKQAVKRYWQSPKGRTKARENNWRRRARKANAPGNGWTNAEFQELCASYGNKCLCCGGGDVPLAADHIVPLARGGADSLKNCQPLCKQCNSKKHAQTIDYRDTKEEITT